MIEPELAEFLNGHLMTVAAAPAADGRLVLARSMGLDCRISGRLDLFVSQQNWTPFLDVVGPGVLVAVTAARPDTYRSFQLKGPVTEVVAPSAEEAVRVTRWVEGTRSLLSDLGIPLASVAQWLTDRALVRVRIQAVEIYEQTPGPRAGVRLATA